MEPIYWKQKDGTLISVDDMSINHLRNTLKMIIKNLNKIEAKQVKPTPKFELHGDIAQDHFDSFANNWQVEQAYAQILTHPGVPSVYWKHYFEWGSDLQNKISALINARKIAGVTSGSRVDMQGNARTAGVYAARITGSHGMLYVRIGGNEQKWQPSDSGYADYREYARGAGWQVCVRDRQ